jgi:hypothetical protein
MHTRRPFVACLLAFCAVAAVAQEPEPLFEFKGVPLRTSEEEFRKVHADFVCSDVGGDAKALGDRVCHGGLRTPFTYGGVPVKIVAAYFYADRLSTVNVSIEERHFRTLSQTLVEAFGSPASSKEDELSTRAGGTYTNTTNVWRKGASTVMARRYAGRIDTSSVGISTLDATAEFQRRREAQSRKGAKDL